VLPAPRAEPIAAGLKITAARIAAKAAAARSLAESIAHGRQSEAERASPEGAWASQDPHWLRKRRHDVPIEFERRVMGDCQRG
jgi:hypothetical protein